MGYIKLQFLNQQQYKKLEIQERWAESSCGRPMFDMRPDKEEETF